jgi:hypothetical protein
VIRYHVNYGGLSGFLQPIRPDGSSLFSRGRSVPAKLRLDGDDVFGFDTSGWSIGTVNVACDASTNLAEGGVGSVTPRTTFRYDPADDQYIYNADFANAAVGSCWKLRASLDSGQSFDSAKFRLQR